MSKRTTPESKTTSDAPAPRRRAAKPAADVASVAAPKAPRTRRTATTTEVTASDEVSAPADAPQPSHDEIAIRAYFISIEQGADPVAAWLLAERELTTA